TTDATTANPRGVALDRATGSIYWANSTSATAPIASTKTDNTGGGDDLDVTGATPSTPRGPAIDLAGGKIYWPNSGNNTISYANLDDSSGGGQLNVTSATLSGGFGMALDPDAGSGGRGFQASESYNTTANP